MRSPNLLGAVSPQLPGMALPDEYPDPVLPAALVQEELIARTASGGMR